MEAPGGPTESGRSNVLLRRIPTFLTCVPLGHPASHDFTYSPLTHSHSNPDIYAKGIKKCKRRVNNIPLSHLHLSSSMDIISGCSEVSVHCLIHNDFLSFNPTPNKIVQKSQRFLLQKSLYWSQSKSKTGCKAVIP